MDIGNLSLAERLANRERLAKLWKEKHGVKIIPIVKKVKKHYKKRLKVRARRKLKKGKR